MSFLKTLQQRELIQDVSDEENITSLGEGDSFYIGFDPTAPSLQIGNLVPLMATIHLARAGLTPIVLFGGATGAIGDPRETEERTLMSREDLDRNIENQQRKTKEILDRVGVGVEFVNNFDWTHKVTMLEFLRDIGKHFTVNYMIAKEVVKTRLGGSGISFTEFSYMLLQANDFLHLLRERNCKLQIGGSDQWGNITAGLELIRRKGAGEAFALSHPLITDSQGKKFGKSEGGAVWVDEQSVSPYKFHQFWLNVSDQDVIRYLKIFTLLDLDEIDKIEQETGIDPGQRVAQRALADAVCSLVHGEDATAEAKKSAEVLFGGSIAGMSDNQLEDIFSDVPSSLISRQDLSSTSFLDILVTTSLVKSRGEGKRLVANGGAYLNNERCDDPSLALGESSVAQENLFVLRTGKKNYHLVKVEG